MIPQTQNVTLSNLKGKENQKPQKKWQDPWVLQPTLQLYSKK